MGFDQFENTPAFYLDCGQKSEYLLEIISADLLDNLFVVITVRSLTQ